MNGSTIHGTLDRDLQNSPNNRHDSHTVMRRVGSVTV